MNKGEPVQPRPYQRCERCVMDTTIQEITFDEQGICNYCKTYEMRVNAEILSMPQREQARQRLVETIRKAGTGRAYDCIIGVSGGVDSSYVAHLVKEAGLRPLAVHLDNGWNSELAVENIEKLLKKLDIDLYTHVINWEEFKDLQRAFILSSVENLEIPTDHAINALLLKMADKHKIRYILNGSNLVTEGILPIQGGRNLDYRLIMDIHKRFGTRKLQSYPKMDIFRFAYLFLVKKIKYIPFLNYFDYDKAKAINLLESNYGWRRYGGKHYESIFTRFFQGYILPRKYHYDKRKAHFSTLIMSNQMTRDEALKLLQEDPYPDQALLKEDFDFFLKKFDFTPDAFEKIMEQPPADPTKFRSYEALFARFAPVVQKIKAYAKGT